MTCVSDLEWKTATGRKIRLGDMTDKHLDNALAMVKRLRDKWNAEAAAATCPHLTSPDSMAAYYADHAMNDALDKATIYAGWVEAFEIEKSRRKKPVDE